MHPCKYIIIHTTLHMQGRRKQLESGEAKHSVISISIQEVLCSYVIVAEGNSAAKGSSC